MIEDPNDCALAYEAEAAAYRARIATMGNQIERLRAAIERMGIGCNHIATYRTDLWPDYGTDPADALEKLGAGREYDMWCCWNAHMCARDVRTDEQSAPADELSEATIRRERSEWPDKQSAPVSTELRDPLERWREADRRVAAAEAHHARIAAELPGDYAAQAALDRRDEKSMPEGDNDPNGNRHLAMSDENRLIEFLKIAQNARWRLIPPCWREEMRMALSEDLVTTKWGGVLVLNERGKQRIDGQSEQK